MAETVYILCALMSAFCTVFLVRGYWKHHTQLLLWSSVSFGLLTVSNIFLFIDLVIFPDVDIHLLVWRAFFEAVAGVVLLFGLVWELT